MEIKICQSCGMKLNEKKDFGLNSDETVNADYCKYCYADGKFTSDCSMSEQIEQNLKYLDEFNREENTGFSKAQAREEMTKYFPTLKRWRCTCTDACAVGYNPDCTCTSSECHCTEKPLI